MWVVVWGNVSGGVAVKPKDSHQPPLSVRGEEVGCEKELDKDGGQYCGEVEVVPTGT